MDTGIGSFSAPAAMTRPAAPRAPEPPREVQQARAAQDAQSRPASPPPLGDNERRVEIDAETSSLIYRTVEIATGAVLSQTPDEARLRLRAYIDGVGAGRSSQALVSATA
ncbi:hypothetical protein GCM10008171_18400 [Methylopila jiangsuensis]|uniref:Flagellar protein FlaG n=1 Tax=Methylopila jiangsuensis TaxID=586230 RepID=A0A9W6N3T7_9HYPH|nr:hypothetical protein [Methylopila jiangsuensis]MDR6287099.1 hypothetical protein [Methylopila jiangsuensis]GLK76586.1 hypothetical protein GCM10008171_18400 [Methylopila jiangsuensis]